MMTAMLSANRNVKLTMRSRIKRALSVVSAATMLVATSAWAVTLANISYTSLPGDRVPLRLELSDPVNA